MFHRKGKKGAGGDFYPPVNPDIFGRLQPEIDAACDEWIRSGVKVPTREAVEQTARRIYDNVCKKYPDMAEFALVFDRNFPMLQSAPLGILGVDIQADGAFAGLLAFLLLAGFFFRRRRYGRYYR